eukprot:GHVS01040315.1.p1 GENE.GHVS01040315.1~~GHVS01040315.1.p1  ORF type:complete len:172 (+),score=32.06 GHVS01040315.1:40-516(+)
MSSPPAVALSCTASSVEPEGALLSRWCVLYPHYLNANKTAGQGRKVSQTAAVENPACHEMKVVCEHLGIPAKAEMDKSYPRDWMTPGRIRYCLRKENGEFIDPSIRTKRQLMNRLCELIPKLKSRLMTQSSSSSSSSSSGPTSVSSASSKSKKKKKGK